MTPHASLVAGALAAAPSILLASPCALDAESGCDFRVPEVAAYRLRDEPVVQVDAAPFVRPPAPRPGPSVATFETASKPYKEAVVAAAKANGLDPALVHAVIAAESGYRVDAVSPRGAIGLMQIMPVLGQRYGVTEGQLRDPNRNIQIGARFLAYLMNLFNHEVPLALAGYNAGEWAVKRHGGQIPPYAETQAYVFRVLRYYGELRAHHAP